VSSKLTDAKLQALKPPEKGQTEHSDSDVPGMRVRIGTTGAKTFILRKRVAGQLRNITLGLYGPRFGLADARRKARALISDLENGKALPSPANKSTSTAGTIRAMMAAYLASQAHLRSIEDLTSVMNNFVLPHFGDRFADSITRGEITEFIAEIAERTPPRARTVHAQLSAFYTWAMPRLDRLQANPCRDAGRPPKPKARDRVLTDAELVGLWKVAEAERLPWGPGLKLLILTGARRSEVFQADRFEFDLKTKEWTIPASRAKNGLPHIIPLSQPAIETIKAIPESDDSTKLFPSGANAELGATGYSKARARFRTSLDKMLERKAGEHWTLHDIRRTVATGLQRLGVRFEVTEAVLNHVSGAKGGIAGVYQRHDWKTEKREALTAWARHLNKLLKSQRGSPARQRSGR